MVQSGGGSLPTPVMEVDEYVNIMDEDLVDPPIGEGYPFSSRKCEDSDEIFRSGWGYASIEHSASDDR